MTKHDNEPSKVSVERIREMLAEETDPDAIKRLIVALEIQNGRTIEEIEKKYGWAEWRVVNAWARMMNFHFEDAIYDFRPFGHSSPNPLNKFGKLKLKLKYYSGSLWDSLQPFGIAALPLFLIVAAGFALKYMIQIYLAGNLGLSMQVGGMGFLATLMALEVILHEFYFEPGENWRTTERESDRFGTYPEIETDWSEDEYILTKTYPRIEAVQLLLALGGLAMLIGGYFI